MPEPLLELRERLALCLGPYVKTISDDMQTIGRAISGKIAYVSRGTISQARAQKILKIFITTFPLSVWYFLAPVSFIAFWITYEVVHIRSDLLDRNVGFFIGLETGHEWYLFARAAVKTGFAPSHLVTALFGAIVAIYYFQRCNTRRDQEVAGSSSGRSSS